MLTKPDFFTIYVNQTIMLCTLNLQNDVWQLCVNKTGEKPPEIVTVDIETYSNYMLLDTHFMDKDSG